MRALLESFAKKRYSAVDIEFIDLGAQQRRLKPQIDAAIATVLSHGSYVMGPEVKEFEAELATYGQTKHALGCANGTDAIILALIAMGIGRGDAVFCPSFTYCATAEAVASLGATPIFVDIDRQSYNLCAESLLNTVRRTRIEGKLALKAVIAVDLFGQSADYPRIRPIVDEYNMRLISDSAQGFGTSLGGQQPAHWADVTTTSFFPAKPLGCYGDGGALLTNNDTLANIIDSARIHGKGADKYDNVRIGMNSRLDTLQAAILRPKLAIFSNEIEARNRVAARYHEGLSAYALRVPYVLDNVVSTWAQYTIEVKDPLKFAERLKAKGVPTARYYPRPIHQQTAYLQYTRTNKNLDATEDAIDRIISLPMHPYLDVDTQDFIIETAKTAIN